MRIGLTGLSNSGKTTLFNALTGQRLETTVYPTMQGDPHLGVVKVPDDRIDRLAEIYRPRKVTFATIEYIDYLGLTKGDLEQNLKVIELVKDVEALVHVVRAFEDDTVVHPFASIDPLRDVETVELELVLGDLELVEKRLQRMEEGAKKGKKPNEAEKRLLLKCRSLLLKEVALRGVSFDKEELKTMRHLQFISTKPEVVVVNVGERELKSDQSRAVTDNIARYFEGRGLSASTRVLSLCGRIEMEISQLRPEEGRMFLNDLGIAEPALNRLIRVTYDLLGLQSFITVGDDEVRAWTIRKGTTARRAAGKVHSDIERGFIRAEVVKFEELAGAGSLAAARERGAVRLEGKDYIVKDGDVINFRFNV